MPAECLVCMEPEWTQTEIKIRFLCPEDIDDVKALGQECFPIEYPDAWYVSITTADKYYALAANHSGRLVGMIVGEMKCRHECNPEDRDILASMHFPDTQVLYILSLGVKKEYRRHGIASLLLDNLVQYSKSFHSCKAIYLHVMCSNSGAIQFYERNNFRMHNLLTYYYSIKGRPFDGYTYVQYVNDGQPPWYLRDYLTNLASIVVHLWVCELWSMPCRVIRCIARWAWGSVKNNSLFLTNRLHGNGDVL